MKRDVIGKLNRRVTIQEDQGTTADGFGQHVESWADLFKAWAAIEPLSGREAYNAAQMQQAIDGKMTLRYRGDKVLTADMRAKLGSRIFQFAGPARNIDERNGFWEIPFTEVITNPV